MVMATVIQRTGRYLPAASAPPPKGHLNPLNSADTDIALRGCQPPLLLLLLAPPPDSMCPLLLLLLLGCVGVLQPLKAEGGRDLRVLLLMWAAPRCSDSMCESWHVP
jgi:hypothetical protein